MKHTLVQTDVQTRVAERIEVDINEVVPNSRERDYTGVVVVLKRESLNEPFASGDRRFHVSGGFGAKPGALGTKVFGRYIADGAKDYVRRASIAGVAKVQEYPPFPPELEY